MKLKLLYSSLQLLVLLLISSFSQAQSTVISYTESDGVNDLQFYRGETMNLVVSRSYGGNGIHYKGYGDTIVVGWLNWYDNTSPTLAPGTYKAESGNIYRYTEEIEVFDPVDGIYSWVEVVTYDTVWEASLTYTVLERPLATVALTTDKDALSHICAGTDVTFTAITTGAGITDTAAGFSNGPTYDWYKGNNLVLSGTTSNTFTTTVADGEEVYAVLHPAFKANPTEVSSLPAALNVIEAGLPVIADITSASAICNQQQTIFNGALSNLAGTTTYQWLRNGTRVAGATNASWSAADISVAAPEELTLIVTNDVMGCTATDSFTKTVQAVPTPLPVVYVTAGSKTLCSGKAQEVVFGLKMAGTTGQPINQMPLFYQWAKDGGNITGATDATYTATDAGSYSLILTDQITGCSKTSSAQQVVINQSPTADVTANGTTSLCPSASVMLTANATPGASLKWRRGTTTVGTAASYNAKIAGDYTLIATKNGCSDTSAIVPVTVKAAPNTTVVYNGATNFCVGDYLILDAVENSSYAYQWYQGANAIIGATDYYYVATTNGSYKVAISNDGCTPKNSASTKITVTTLPLAKITKMSQNANTAVLRGNNGASIYGYQWYLDSSPIAGATSQNFTATANGYYMLELSRNGCTTQSELIEITGITATGMRMAAAEEKQNAILIYPNPSEGLFNIAAEDVVTVIVRDVQGRVVANIANATTVDLTAQPAGVYLMQIMDAKGNLLQSERLMKR